MNIEKSNALKKFVLCALRDLSLESTAFFDSDTIRWKIESSLKHLRYSINNRLVTHILIKQYAEGKVQMKSYKYMRLFRYGKQR